MILGNVINPYFPKNLWLFWEHFATKFKIGSDFAVAVGGEWYPYTGMELLTHFPVAMIAMLIGYILFMPKNGKLPEKATFFLMFVSILARGTVSFETFCRIFSAVRDPVRRVQRAGVQHQADVRTSRGFPPRPRAVS